MPASPYPRNGHTVGHAEIEKKRHIDIVLIGSRRSLGGPVGVGTRTHKKKKTKMKKERARIRGHTYPPPRPPPPPLSVRVPVCVLRRSMRPPVFLFSGHADGKPRGYDGAKGALSGGPR